MGKKRKARGQKGDAEERMFNCRTQLDYPTVFHSNQCVHSKESQGCECDMVSSMKGEYLLYVEILPNSHPFFNVSRCHLITEVHHKLGKLLHIDNVLRVLRISIDYLCTSNTAKDLIRVRNLTH